MIKKTFLLTSMAIELSVAQALVDCRVLISGVHECNPYSHRLKYIRYEEEKHQFYSSKKRPIVLVKHRLEVISSQEILEAYTKRTKALYFKETTEVRRPIVFVPKKIEFGYYTIVSGDVLGRIAKKFEISLAKLIRLNRLKNTSAIKIGQKLSLPMEQNRIDNLATGTYTVAKGDTLVSIAKKFGFTAKDLREFNPSKEAGKLVVGKVLKLPLPYIVAKIKAKQKREAEIKKLRLLGYGTHKLRVTATAYTSHKNQTDSTPFIAAWNNRIRPGMKMIAVSRDLLKRKGIKDGAKVKISGLPGIYKVKDKMNKRYRKRIDIYMGMNKRKALKWGRRSVVIYW